MLFSQRKFYILQQQAQARAICQQSVKLLLCVRLGTELWMGLAGSKLLSPSHVANDWVSSTSQVLSSLGYHVVTFDYRGEVLF